MIINIFFEYGLDEYWTDEAIKGLVGQKTSVFGCPGEVVGASRASQYGENAVELRILINNVYGAYMQMSAMYRKEGIDIVKIREDITHGTEEQEGTT